MRVRSPSAALSGPLTTLSSWSATLSAVSGAALFHWGFFYQREWGRGVCFLFSLHALVATVLLTRVGPCVYFRLDTRTVQDQQENQWNRAWQENMRVPSGDGKKDSHSLWGKHFVQCLFKPCTTDDLLIVFTAVDCWTSKPLIWRTSALSHKGGPPTSNPCHRNLKKSDCADHFWVHLSVYLRF